ncbi:MAG: glycosyltransferase family 2 protein [Gemmatimonadota bacterium]|nr:glycosyltransferase family 2 protein [Gemmatimonadota bacterium]
MSKALATERVAEVSERCELELTILMPCLDEAETVAACVKKACRYLEEHGVEGEVLVSDNGSTDGSPELAAAAGARVVTAPRKGYGSALMTGIREARGKFVIMGDADESYDFSRLDGFIRELRAGHDLVMGNRFAGGIAPGAMPASHRYLGNPVLSFIGRLFFRSSIGDFHCGLRGFRRDAILDLGLTTEGMEFASEMVVKSTLRDLRVTEVPTTLSPDGRSTPPHLRRWRDGWRHLRFLLLFSPRWLFLHPGIGLMLAGLVSMALLLAGPRRIGAVSLDVNTLVYSAVAIVGGFQLAALAVFAKVYAIGAGLLPADPKVRRFRSAFTLEWGIIVGATLLVAGLGVGGYAVGFWGSAEFGPLDPRVSLRIVIPSATAMLLGLQVISAAFFLSVLGLDTVEPTRG